MYDDAVIFSLEEMALDRSHVEHRLLLAMSTHQAQQEHPISHIQQLINQCEWQILAKMLLNDRDLARDLDDKFFGDGVRESIQQKINAIEGQYFDVLTSPTDFIISKHAMDMFSRHSSTIVDHTLAHLLEMAPPRSDSPQEWHPVD